MHKHLRMPGEVSGMRRFFVLAVVLVLLLTGSVFGQKTTGTINGTATDASGAALPGAAVELINAASGDVRHVTTNAEGFFAIVSVPPGTYNLKVSSTGFTPYEAKGIVMTQGDSRTVANIVLKVGGVSEKIEVVAEGSSVAPVDTGAVSTTLNQTMVDEFTITSRTAGELMKILPGMATNSGLSANASFNGADKTTGSNAGPAGSFSSNGLLPNGSMSYMLDGANLLDNNMGTQIANINPEMVSEVKVLQSTYGAEFAKGPMVFQAFTKSGGNTFHGEGYFFARNGELNSLNSYQKAIGNKSPDSHHYYPGFNIGGPVIIPGTRFNKSREKLFFWFGYERMYQQSAGNLIQYFVPTAEMKAGNFSPEYLATLTPAPGWTNAFNAPCANATAGGCPGLNLAGGRIPQSQMDPNGLAYMNLFPAPNANPGQTGGYNFQFNNTTPQNRWEQSERVDYAINDNNKLSVSYTYQREYAHRPIATWWAPTQALPYPSEMLGKTPSSVISVNYTKVFSSTLVNEFVGAYATYLNAIEPVDSSKVDRTKLGMTYKALFGATTTQMSDLLSWSSGVPDFMPQAVFGGSEWGGKFGAKKYSPNFSDNLSMVWGTHNLKFGFYWDTSGNQGSYTGGNGNYNGQFEVETYGGTSTNNTVADLLLGHIQSYGQQNKLMTPKFQNHQVSFYAQDSWKATRRLTLNYGLRLDHVGQWYNPEGNGVIVWDPSKYSETGGPNTGILWHAKDSSVPVSGWITPTFYYAPRFSLAYDVFGNAKTVLRGGAAKFYFTQGSIDNSDANSSGLFTYQTPNALTSFSAINSLTNIPQAGGPLNGTTITPNALGDDRMPHTWDYNLTISQALPWRTLAEFSYVGSATRDMVIGTTNNHINNANIIPEGALFGSDPVTGAAGCIKGSTTSCNPNLNNYARYRQYQNIYVMSHGSYSNYNSFQATFTRSVKPVVLVANYVFGKVLGTWDGVSSNGAGNAGTVNGFSLDKNYGPLAYNHTHIFNVSYSVDLPKATRNRIAGAALNGWTLSGWTGIQSGTPLQPNANGNFNVQYPSGMSNQSWLGTNAMSLMPVLTCDPRSGLSSGQYFNPDCFAPPAPGRQGSEIWPFLTGPTVINSDLSLFKSFNFGEHKKLQFRLQAYNFLNHANAQFNANGSNSDIQLDFRNAGSSYYGIQGLSARNTNALMTGKPRYEVGNRLIELAVKFYF